MGGDNSGRTSIEQSQAGLKALAHLASGKEDGKGGVFNISYFAEKIGISPSSLSQAVTGTRPLPEKYVGHLTVLLKEFGFKTKDNWHVYDDEGKTYICSLLDGSTGIVKENNGHISVKITWAPFSENKKQEAMASTMKYWYLHNYTKLQ